MQGFCPNDKTFKKMDSVTTEILPNGRFIQRGKCHTCQGVIVKVVRPDEMETHERRRVPKEIFVGKNTPSRLAKAKKMKERKQKQRGL